MRIQTRREFLEQRTADALVAAGQIGDADRLAKAITDAIYMPLPWVLVNEALVLIDRCWLRLHHPIKGVAVMEADADG